jgi:hypothetical protein
MVTKYGVVVNRFLGSLTGVVLYSTTSSIQPTAHYSRMPETKAKRPSRKKVAAANSPIPTGPGSTCGHSGCSGPACQVRYAGATSHPRDHMLHEVSRGVRHIWTASIVAGLAVVLTGSIAYTAVQAETAPKVKNINEGVGALWRKLDNMERLLKQIAEKNGISTGTTQSTTSTKPRPEPTGCLKTCNDNWLTCKQQAGTDTAAYEVCHNAKMQCGLACTGSANAGTTQ